MMIDFQREILSNLMMYKTQAFATIHNKQQIKCITETEKEEYALLQLQLLLLLQPNFPTNL